MKIKDYLRVIKNLPELPYSQEKVQFMTMDEPIYNSNFINNSINNFKKIEFIQDPYTDRFGKIKYRWKEANKVNIDYKVDNIYIKSTNDLIFATLIDLTYKYNFKNWTSISSNMKSCYIDFEFKSWAICDSLVDEFYCIDDDSIIENIFMSSLNEYPNGVPIIWEDL